MEGIRRRLMTMGILLLVLTGPVGGGAQVPEVGEGPIGNDGEILFSVAGQERPAEGRHPVTPGQEIQVCLKLNSQKVPFFQNLENVILGYRMILEDNQDPPHVLMIAPGNRLKRMEKGPDGCFGGPFQIPALLPAAIYQVADLLLARDDQSYYSVRDYLYNFSQVDELEVANPATDTAPPRLLGIDNEPNKGNKVKVSRTQVKIQLGQGFLLEDTGVGLDNKSIKVLYALSLDDKLSGYSRAQCRATRPKGRFFCRLKLVRPVEEWAPRKVTLTLNSLTIQDMAGNKLAMTGEESFQEQAKSAPLSFDFYPQPLRSKKPRHILQKDSLYGQ